MESECSNDSYPTRQRKIKERLEHATRKADRAHRRSSEGRTRERWLDETNKAYDDLVILDRFKYNALQGPNGEWMVFGAMEPDKIEYWRNLVKCTNATKVFENNAELREKALRVIREGGLT